MNDELNYKQAYYYLFSKISDIIDELQKIQLNAEQICTSEALTHETKTDTARILKNIAEHIKEHAD